MYVRTCICLSACVRACVRVCVRVHAARVGRMRAWRSENKVLWEMTRVCVISHACVTDARVRSSFTSACITNIRVRVRVRMRARPSVRRCGVTAEPYSSPGNNARSPCNSDTVNANRSPSTANCHASLAGRRPRPSGAARSRSVAMPDFLEFLPRFCTRACSIGVW